MELEIRDARVYHVGRLVRRLRDEQLNAWAEIGCDPHQELRQAYAQSYFCRTAFLEGEIFAMWGCGGTFLSSRGVVWLGITKLAERYPLLLIKETRRQLADMMVTKHELATMILNGDEAGKRFAAFLGFGADHTFLGRPAHSRWARRSLKRYIDSSPDLRIPYGKSFFVRMEYAGDHP